MVADRTSEPYDAALFDLDGVLVNSRQVMEGALRAAWNSLHLPGVPEFSRFEKNLGRPLAQIFSILGWPSELTQLFVAESRRHVRDVPVYCGVREILDLARESGIRLAVVTGKEHLRAAEILQAHGMLETFGALIGGDDCARGKPDSAPVLAALDALGIPPRRALMVGDSPLDMQAAAAAGVLPVGALWGYSADIDLIDAGARLLLKHPRELADELLGIRQAGTS
jgi:3-amino-5-hydroxybenzoic acid synthesis related protein